MNTNNTVTAPTPETDALIAKHMRENCPCSSPAFTSFAVRQARELIEHARQLERDRDRLLAMRDEVWLAGQCAKLRAELVEARKAIGVETRKEGES